jgi:NAD(P)-dependent dehydrogenase (short-subunit alcohol dehydrogenase family)
MWERQERKFRDDLYYRLNVFPMTVPPLRERAGDIAVLVRYFANKFSRRMNRPIERIPAQAMEALTRHHWPGNARELQNVIERAVILSTDGVLRVPLPELTSSPNEVSSAFHTIRAAIPLMKERGWGRIVNIGSAHSLVASPFKSAYVAAKHGMLGLTKTVALEVARDHLQCDLPRLRKDAAGRRPDPGYRQGAGHHRGTGDPGGVMLGEQPTKKFVTVEELGGLTVFLCSDEAASITGTAIPVDGG